ncbi:MAG: hypothetical protein ACOZDY_06880 [Pseudomonadota bacterium]
MKSVVEAVLSGFKNAREFKIQIDRDNAIEAMLRLYFVLKDCVDEGEALIVEAGSNPLAKLKAMSLSEATETVRRWDMVLRCQGIRLRMLEGMLYGQSQLAVISPEVEVALNKAIGYKMNRTVTLHGIGAGLFLRCMFPMEETEKQKAELIAFMAGEKGRNAINLGRIRTEVEDLRSALESYRQTVQQLASNAEILKLSAKARESTRAPAEPNPSYMDSPQEGRV